MPVPAYRWRHSRGYRSGLEDKIAAQIKDRGLPCRFEDLVIRYWQPVSQHRYTPDFVLPNGIIIESKGKFEADDRKKHLLVKDQYPELDIRFVFSNPNARLYKGSPTTYGMWCEKNGFKYAKKLIPTEWFDEPPRRCLRQVTKGGILDDAKRPC